MSREHYFKDKNMIVCKETNGEFSVELWNNGKIPLNYCPCCKKEIDPKELKK